MRTSKRETRGLLGNSSLTARIASLLRRRDASPFPSANSVAIAVTLMAGLLPIAALSPNWIAFAQPAPAFEVISIKPNHSGVRRYDMSRPAGDRFVATNVTVEMLLEAAGKVEDFQISGAPPWVKADRFDIEAKAPPGTARDQFPAMLSGLLESRFHLQSHRETADAAVYVLSVARNGAKLRTSECVGKPSPVNPCGAFSGSARGDLMGRTAPMSELAAALTRILGRRVLDRTGLTGNYDVDLHWTPNQSSAAGPPSPDEGPADPNGPTIFTAVEEQLGLKLNSSHAPQEYLVIDHIGKPDAN